MRGGAQTGARGLDLRQIGTTARSDAEAFAMVYDMRTVNPETLMPPFGTNVILSEIVVLMIHPMEAGQRKAPDGNVIPAHFIQRVNDKPVLVAHWGPAISKNPLLGFRRVKGAKAGDKLVIAWEDNKGEKSSAEAIIA